MKQKNEPILEVENLAAGYGDHIVLENVSFKLNKGEVLGVIGQNGSGKSTLLKAICGLIPLKEGTVSVNGKQLQSWSPHSLVKMGISYFPQGGLVMKSLTVEEHLLLALRNSYKSPGLEHVYGQFPRLVELKKQRAGSLSGGERQILSFGILTTQGTHTWLLDEPTAGLSPQLVEKTSSFLNQRTKDKTVLIIEHNLNVVFSITSNILIVKHNTITIKHERSELVGEIN